MPPLQGQWLEALKPEFKKPYYKELFTKVGQEYQRRKIFPAPDDIFNAFHLTPLDQVKVVILGQDPYHNDGQAHGLCFSVKPDVEIPPSLVNIYQELHDDCGCYIPDNGYLVKWARQGVLLLNHRFDRPCPSGEFPQRYRLGGIYRCSHPGPERAGQAYRFYALGKTGADEESHAEQSQTSDTGSASSQSFVGFPGIFRLQTFQQSQCFSHRAWTGAY